jgi:hypothetical protein
MVDIHSLVICAKATACYHQLTAGDACVTLQGYASLIKHVADRKGVQLRHFPRVRLLRAAPVSVAIDKQLLVCSDGHSIA